MRKILFVLFLFFSIFGNAQNNYQKFLYLKFISNIGDGPVIRYDQSENIYVSTNRTFFYFTLSKVDTAGNFLWNKSYHNGAPKVRDFQITPDNSIILSGYLNYNSLQLIPFISKVDFSGNIIWTKAIYDSLYTSYAGFYDPKIKCTNDSGFITITVINNNSNTQEHIRVIKFDSNGNVEWYKNFGSGSISFDWAFLTITDSGYVLNYCFNGNLMIVIKLDLNGNFVWGKGFKSLIPGSYFYTGEIILLTDGNFLFSLIRDPSITNLQSLLVKLDSNGTLLWSKSCNGYINHSNALKQTDNDHYLISFNRYALATFPSSYLMQIDSSGFLNWTKSFKPDSLIAPNYAYENFSSFDVFNNNKIAYLNEFPNFVNYDLMITQTDTNFADICIVKDTTFIITNFVFDVDSILPDQTYPNTSTLQIFNPVLIDSTFIPLDSLPCAPLGIQLLENQNQLDISPNPASTEFLISNFNFQPGNEITMTDVLGKIFFTKKFNAPTSNFKLQTTDFPNGIYFLQLITIGHGERSRTMASKKVVVQH